MFRVQLTFKNIFRAKGIGILAKIYKKIYDNSPLSNTSRKNSIFSNLFLKLPHFATLYIKTSDNNLLKMKIDTRNTQYHSVYFDKYRNGYETDVISLIDFFLKKDGVFYDIGSNWGHHSLYAIFSDLSKNIEVFAFDVQTEVLNDLMKFKQDNNIDQLNILNVALSDSSEKDISFCSRDNFHTGLYSLSNDKKLKKIKTSTLDSLNLRKPDLIKVDVEGMEINVLLGSLKTIKNSRPVIIFENPKYDSFLINETLGSLEYKLYSIYVVSNSDNICKMELRKYDEESLEKNILCIPNEKIRLLV